MFCGVSTGTFWLVPIYYYFYQVITRLINDNARRTITASLARIVYLEVTITHKISATLVPNCFQCGAHHPAGLTNKAKC